MSLPYQFLTDGLQQVRLAAAGIPEHEDVLRLLQEGPVEQRAHLPRRLRRKPFRIERLQGLLQRQLRLPQHLDDAILLPLLALSSHQFVKIPLVAERFALGLPRDLFVALPHRRQVQVFQTLREFSFDIDSAAHCTPSEPLRS